MINVVENKKELRKQAKALRKEYVQSGYQQHLSTKIVQKILNSKDFQEAKNVAIYYPLEGEIDLRSLLSVKNKIFYLPRCLEYNLEFVKYSGFNNLEIGLWNLFEPKGEAINPEILDIIYIPALIANSKKFRLGYGKGYYDRFFSTHKISAKKIIVVAKELINDNFIQDEFDICADDIICE